MKHEASPDRRRDRHGDCRLVGCSISGTDPDPEPTATESMRMLSPVCPASAELAEQLGVELDTPVRVELTAWSADVVLTGPRGRLVRRGEHLRPCNPSQRFVDRPAGTQFALVEGGVTAGGVVGQAGDIGTFDKSKCLTVIGNVELTFPRGTRQYLWVLAQVTIHLLILP